MGRFIEEVARRGRPPAHRGARVAFVAVAVTVGVITVSSGARARAATATPAATVACGTSKGIDVGGVVVTCTGSASPLVAVVVTGGCPTSSALPPACPPLAYAIRPHGGMTAGGGTHGFGVAVVGGTITQQGPLTPSVGSSGSGSSGSGLSGSGGPGPVTVTGPVSYQRIVWTFDLGGPGVATRTLELTYSVGAHRGLGDPSLGIQDSKNIADGAAKSQAVE